jgi:hypothetical protein
MELLEQQLAAVPIEPAMLFLGSLQQTLARRLVPRRPAQAAATIRACGDSASALPQIKRKPNRKANVPDGRNRARTCDLPRVKRTLSQLSYAPRNHARYHGGRFPRARPDASCEMVLT